MFGSFGSYALVLALLVFFNQNVSASSLKKEIAKNQNTDGVIIPSDDSSHNGYQLLILNSQDYAKATELTNPNVLQNSFFKIVDNESGNALSAGDFDGDNVLYHLMVARNYYAKLSLGSGTPDPALDHPVVVRVRVSEVYNTQTHFGTRPSFNDARYIPADPKDRWQSEIWFHARKGKSEHMDWKTLAVGSGISAALGQAILLPAVIPLDIMAHYNFGMDSAKMPNAIYHEAFHWATDQAGLFKMASCGDAVSENYANYFGSSISGRPKLLEINEFTSKYYKRSYEKMKTVKSTHTSDYNYTSYVPALLWKIRDILGADRADQVIWNSMLEFNGVKTNSGIPSALRAALIKDSSITDRELTEISQILDKTTPSLKNLDIRFGLTPISTGSTLAKEPRLKKR